MEDSGQYHRCGRPRPLAVCRLAERRLAERRLAVCRPAVGTHTAVAEQQTAEHRTAEQSTLGRAAGTLGPNTAAGIRASTAAYIAYTETDGGPLCDGKDVRARLSDSHDDEADRQRLVGRTRTLDR